MKAESKSAAAESFSAVPEVTSEESSTGLEQAVSALQINEGESPEENGAEDEETQEREPLDVQIERISEEPSTDSPQPTSEDSSSPLSVSTPPQAHQDPQPNENDGTAQNNDDDAPIYSDPSDEDDGEGEWITPSNVSLHKSRALGFIPDDSAAAKKRSPAKQIRAGCMTADFAMQNVLLQMGLSLIGVEGKRIERVKTWVLRCHACFKYVYHYLTSRSVKLQLY